jgi:pimeloyl-ACP methyl ester carboxylesterase
MSAGPISEERVDVGGVGVFVRRREGEGDPVVFVHGNPSHSADWIPFLERLERPAIAYDVPGWGRSDRPRNFDYSMRGLAGLHQAVLDTLSIDRHALVVHDWGSLALIDAMARPSAIERLVIINAVPLLPGYRWHWIARWFWRVPVVGELFNLTGSKAAFRFVTRQATSKPGPLPEAFIEETWACRQRGTGRPTLELYRSADPGELAAAGFGLGRLDCPALVVWGLDDPYLDPSFGRGYADRLPAAEFAGYDRANHWPWLDRPEIVARVAAFLNAS